jgi:hypothetical protein
MPHFAERRAFVSSLCHDNPKPAILAYLWPHWMESHVRVGDALSGVSNGRPVGSSFLSIPGFYSRVLTVTARTHPIRAS